MMKAKFDVICHAPQVGVCGLNCKHCWVTDNLKQNKPLDEVKQMIDAMAELREEPVLAETTILYFLDELTLHPDLIEILRYCRERDVLPQQFLVSNGLGLASRENWTEILNELKKCGLKGFLMTINGDAEYHDWFTGVEGSFDKTLTATRRANAYGFKVVWNMYLTNGNLPKVIEAARMKGDERFRVTVPISTIRWIHSDIHPDIDVLNGV
ncbi:MAG: radical SAM protein, partial [Candidatus Aegiribacteria sp.]|nr:radical SAM protein [Candidatus Aegiribacteria sp.]